MTVVTDYYLFIFCTEGKIKAQGKKLNIEIIYRAFAYESRDERHIFVTPTVYEELSQERSDTALKPLLVRLATVTFVQTEKSNTLYFHM